MSILIGCDPELFLKKDGLFRSAYGLIKGDKKNPFPVDKGAVQVDGMALELNIHPASSAEEFSQNIETVLTQMKAMVPEYEVVATPTAEFELEYFASQPHDALALGCEPDFNAYSFEENPRPRTDKPIRTGGGHIHIGWGEGLDTSKGSDHFFHCASLTRVLDTYVGSLSLLWDADDERRGLYGRAGAFRPKSYGVEYRVLSNKWMSDKRLISLVFSKVSTAFSTWMDGYSGNVVYQDIINKSKIDSVIQVFFVEFDYLRKEGLYESR